MHQLQPMITSFDDALEYIANYGRPGATWFDAYPQAFVLQGGSLRHPIAISLTFATHGRKMFRDYLIFDYHRLVIRDNLYRTKYALSEYEHAALKLKMIDFCRKHTLRVAVRSTSTMPEYLAKAAEEFFADSGVKWNIKSPRQRPLDELEALRVEISQTRTILNVPADKSLPDAAVETIEALMQEIHVLENRLVCPVCGSQLTTLLLCPTCGVRYELAAIKADSIEMEQEN